VGCRATRFFVLLCELSDSASACSMHQPAGSSLSTRCDVFVRDDPYPQHPYYILDSQDADRKCSAGADINAIAEFHWCTDPMECPGYRNEFWISHICFHYLFALMIYLRPKGKINYIVFMLVFLSIIVWTHTISAFITLVSLFVLVAGYVLYELLYNRNIRSFRSPNAQLLIVPSYFWQC